MLFRASCEMLLELNIFNILSLRPMMQNYHLRMQHNVGIELLISLYV